MKKKSKRTKLLSFKRKRRECTATSFYVKIQSESAIHAPHTTKLVSSECQRFQEPPKDLLSCDKCECKEQCPYYINNTKTKEFKFTFSPAEKELKKSKIFVKPIKIINSYGNAQRTTHKIK